MSVMEELDPEDLLECPYEPSHMIRAKRMQRHLKECRKNHLASGEGRCPFNASHVVQHAERRWHLALCPDRHQVHSKIVQEIMDTPGNRGCIETPAYKPVKMFGDSWEDSDITETPLQSWTSKVEKPTCKVDVSLTEEEVRGLNARQRQQLYLKKKAEQEAALKNPPPLVKSEPQCQINPDTSGSRSMALFQQQAKSAKANQVHSDIYTEALRGPQNASVAVGRGFSTGLEAKLPPGSGGLVGRGRGQGLQKDSATPSTTTWIGRGIGSHAGNPSSQGVDSVDAGFSSKAWVKEHVTAANERGADVDRFTDVERMSVIGMMRMGVETGVQGPRARGRNLPGSLGMWQGAAEPGTNEGRVGSFGRGGIAGPSLASQGIPFAGLTSQPDNTMHGAAWIRGGSDSVSFRDGGIQDSSDSEMDPEQFQDASSSIGNNFPRGSPPKCVASFSNTSIQSSSSPNGTWAEQVEKAEYKKALAAAMGSESSDGDLQSGDSEMMRENEKYLRKLRKKLNQIQLLESRKNEGVTLDADQELKLASKDECERRFMEMWKETRAGGEYPGTPVDDCG